MYLLLEAKKGPCTHVLVDFKGTQLEIKDRVKTRPAPTSPATSHQTRSRPKPPLPHRVPAYVTCEFKLMYYSFQTRLASQSTLAYTHISEPPSNINHSPRNITIHTILTLKQDIGKRKPYYFEKRDDEEMKYRNSGYHKNPPHPYSPPPYKKKETKYLLGSENDESERRIQKAALPEKGTIP